MYKVMLLCSLIVCQKYLALVAVRYQLLARSSVDDLTARPNFTINSAMVPLSIRTIHVSDLKDLKYNF